MSDYISDEVPRTGATTLQKQEQPTAPACQELRNGLAVMVLLRLATLQIQSNIQ